MRTGGDDSTSRSWPAEVLLSFLCTLRCGSSTPFFPLCVSEGGFSSELELAWCLSVDFAERQKETKLTIEEIEFQLLACNIV